jgi:(R)-2-hydroxyacyl-CoA dehydratese activating ATPase
MRLTPTETEMAASRPIFVAGVDVGSGLTKAVILSWTGGEASSLENASPADFAAQAKILGRGAAKTGVEMEKATRTAVDQACEQAGIAPSAVDYIAATGLGRYSIGFRNIQITEITSDACGAHFLFPRANTVIDIGSQSTRAISLTETGGVRQFKTNDKCAAGSGSFIVRAARYLQIPLETVGELALEANNPQPISSICAVLAESEIINHVSAGVTVPNILAGIYDSLADRAALLLKRTGKTNEIVFVGGVARQQGAVRSLERRLKVPVHVPEYCEYACALGAGLLGIKRALSTVRAVA